MHKQIDLTALKCEVKMKNDIQQKNRLMKSSQAAAYLGISSRKLWQLTQQGRVPFVKFDRVLRYDRADLDTFINKMKTVSHSESE